MYLRQQVHLRLRYHHKHRLCVLPHSLRLGLRGHRLQRNTQQFQEASLSPAGHHCFQISRRLPILIPSRLCQIQQLVAATALRIQPMQHQQQFVTHQLRRLVLRYRQQRPGTHRLRQRSRRLNTSQRSAILRHLNRPALPHLDDHLRPSHSLQERAVHWLCMVDLSGLNKINKTKLKMYPRHPYRHQL